MTGIGRTQGYVRKEHKKEVLGKEGDKGEEEEEEIEDMGSGFFWIKQENLHVSEGFLGGNSVSCRHSKR